MPVLKALAQGSTSSTFLNKPQGHEWPCARQAAREHESPLDTAAVF